MIYITPIFFASSVVSQLFHNHFQRLRYVISAISAMTINDSSVTGRELRLAGATHDKGLGLHAAARVTYDLTGHYRRFEALVGLDEDTARRGQVRVRVLVDGKEQKLARQGKLDARGRPLRVRVDVRGARALTLVVAFDRFGDVQAHVNWADARLVK